MPEKLHLVSANYKTTWSINFPIHKTCDPTKTCYRLCYGRRGRLAMGNSLTRQDKVYEVFCKEDPNRIAYEIAKGYRRRNLSFIRWCGVGDLTEDVVNVLNILGTEHSDTVHWVVTRRVDMVAKLRHDMPNVYIGFSLDESDESLERKQAVDELNHPRVYYTFLRETADTDTLGAKIIFDSHALKGQLPYSPKTCCPVDSGKMPMENACSRCKKCFSPRILK